MVIYLDSNNICHSTYKEGYVTAEHSFFDLVCTEAIECYKFIPERDFIQCVDSKNADKLEALGRELVNLVDEVYAVCNDLIGG